MSPTYMFECVKCKHRFGQFRSMKRVRRLADCPKCNGTAERLIGAGSGIIFKGSGFYENDYKKKEKM